MKKKVLVALAAIALTITPEILFAQGPPPPPPPQSVPVDGGLSLLLAAGAALGAKKLYDSNKI